MVRHEHLSNRSFVKAAFSTVLACSPSVNEQAECEQALQELQDLATREKRTNPILHARITLIGALLNHNDFVTIR